jgi:hypothetical protein
MNSSLLVACVAAALLALPPLLLMERPRQRGRR